MQCNGINGGEMKERTYVINERQKIQIPIQKMKVLNSKVDTKVLTQRGKEQAYEKSYGDFEKTVSQEVSTLQYFFLFFLLIRIAELNGGLSKKDLQNLTPSVMLLIW